MSIVKDSFGRTSGSVAVDCYTLCNTSGMTVRVITYGATVTEMFMPDRDGCAGDVVLGFDNLAQYERESPYFGCTVGRVAFRTAGARFSLDGEEFQLTRNDGKHHLHGGTKGFSHVVWKAETASSADGEVLKLTHRSPDGDQGYPGVLDVNVFYTLTERNELRIDYSAMCDRPTPVNLTHHSYFNLAGAGSGDVLRHTLQIEADHYTPSDEQMIPTGQLAPVQGTPLDFTRPRAIGNRMVGGIRGGYDTAYLCAEPYDTLRRVALIHEPDSGRQMEVESTEPAVVFYTGSDMGVLRGKGEAVYREQSGFCLETGRLPDSMHHPEFPTIVLRPGHVYRHTCIYRFTTD